MSRMQSADFEEKSLRGLFGYSYKRYLNLLAFIIPTLMILLTIQYFSMNYILTSYSSDVYFYSLFPLLQFFLDTLTSSVFLAYLAFIFLSSETKYFKAQFFSLKRSILLLGLLIFSSILYFFSVLAGSLLLLIPGFLFLVWYSFFPFNLTFERTGIIESFKRSKQLTKGVFWRILIILGVFHLMREVLHTILLTLQPNDYISYLGASLLTIPAESIALLILYFNRRAEHEALQYTDFLKEVS